MNIKKNINNLFCGPQRCTFKGFGKSTINIEYDLSTFDTDPFEPQPDGMRTIYPFWVERKDANK